MGSIGPMELLVIALIALLLFGAGRIADIGKGLGQGISNFKKGLKEADEDDKPKKAEKAEKNEKAAAKDDDDDDKKEDVKKEKLKEA